MTLFFSRYSNSVFTVTTGWITSIKVPNDSFLVSQYHFFFWHQNPPWLEMSICISFDFLRFSNLISGKTTNWIRCMKVPTNIYLFESKWMLPTLCLRLPSESWWAKKSKIFHLFAFSSIIKLLLSLTPIWLHWSRSQLGVYHFLEHFYSSCHRFPFVIWNL